MADSAIERGVPIPLPQREPIERKYPELLVLEIGDSFVAKKAPFGFHIGIALFGIEHDQRHEVRQVVGDEYRVWRTH
jgi:hypothetical protein